MTPYDEVFFPIFGIGCFVAFVASFAAACVRGIALPIILLMIGVVAFWGALFLGSDLGYRAWQSIDDPPSEAFADTAPMGALIAGWLPGGVFCVFVYGPIRLIRFFLRRPESTIERSEVMPTESSNPYQSPGPS